MYHHIRGELVELNPTRAVVDAGGVGFEVFIPFSTYSALEGRAPGETVTLLTHLLVRETLFRLYGFHTEEERRLFRSVLSVSGFGPATALTILSNVDVGEFSRIVDEGDPAPLEQVKGIGKRLASRLVVELRDRLERLPATAGAGPRAEETAPADAILALVELGYTRREAEARVQAAVSSLGGANGGGSVETILRHALRQ